MPKPAGSSKVTDLGPLSGPTELLALISGSKWGGGLGTGVTLSYSFPWIDSNTAVWSANYGAGNELNKSPFGLNLTESQYVDNALRVFGMYIDVDFNRTGDSPSSVGDLRFAKASLGGSTSGQAYTPNGSASGGDVWLNSSISSWAPGGPGYTTILHEIGHALGLKHPFQGSVRLPSAIDNTDHTIMSYTGGYFAGFESLSPSFLDIAALQALYGPNKSFQAGDDVYTAETFTALFGYTPSFAVQGAGVATLWDAGGVDTFVGWNLIDLRPGSQQILVGETAMSPSSFGTIGALWHIEIAQGVIIENATAMSTGAKITGNDADNVLRGTTGGVSLGYSGVQIHALGGNDTLYSDRTISTTDHFPGDGIPLPGGLFTDPNALFGDDGNDVLYGFIYVDHLEGGSGSDTLFGDAGSDTLVGGLGNDFVDGGDGEDIWSSRGSQSTTISDLEIIQLIDGSYRITDLRPGSPLGTDIVFDVEIFQLLGLGGTTINLATKLTANSDTYVYVDNSVGLGTVILAGGGNDLITQSGSGNARLDGGEGNDTLSGGSGNNVYVIDSDQDVIIEGANAGVDTVWSYVSYTLGPNLENIVLKGLEAINATGNDSDNSLRGNHGANTLSGLDGWDALLGGYGNDLLFGGPGNDNLVGEQGDDRLEGGDDGDWLDGGPGADDLFGGAGDDDFEGGEGNDAFNGGGGTDHVSYARDYIGGGLSAVFVDLANGAATDAFGDIDVLNDIENITGTQFNDTIRGNSGDNVLMGLAGNDTLEGRGGADTLIGGAGNDTYIVDGNDTVIDSGGVDTIRATFSVTLNVDIENVILLGSGALNITGNAAGNTLTGTSGKNTLKGLAGNDLLNGGKGRDVLFGGTGKDDFDFNSIKESKKGGQRDKILDFKRGQDDIDLKTIDATKSASGHKFKWIGKKDFHDKKGELRYEDKGSKVIVQGDVNGDGKADFEIYVAVGSLGKGDFLL